MHRLEMEILLFNCLDQMTANLHKDLCRLLTTVAAIVDTFLVLDELQIKQKNVYIHDVK